MSYFLKWLLLSLCITQLDLLECVGCLGVSQGQTKLVEDDLSTISFSSRQDFNDLSKITNNHPYLLPFEWFVQKYQKHYSDMISRLMHHKSYLSSLARVLASKVQYRLGTLSHFLKVGWWSDMTPDEKMDLIERSKKRRLNKHHNRKPLKQRPIRNKLNRPSQSDEANRKCLAEMALSRPYVQKSPYPLRGERYFAHRCHDGEIWRPPFPVLGAERLGELPPLPKVPEDQKDAVFVDHRTVGGSRQCLGPAKEQEECSSCYIFAMMAAFEWQHCRDTGRHESFSEQYVLDCGRKWFDMKGCASGEFHDVLEFSKRFGLERQASYPYLGKESDCPLEIANKSVGYWQLNPIQFYKVNRTYLENYLMRGPIVTAVYFDSELLEYGGGVHAPSSARCWSLEASHAMLMVGSGRQNGVDYFLFRNSWSSEWGEQGYYKLAKESMDACVYWDDLLMLSATMDRKHRPLIRMQNPQHDIK